MQLNTPYIMSEFKVRFSNDVENVYYNKITGRITRSVLSLNIDKFVIDNYINFGTKLMIKIKLENS